MKILLLENIHALAKKNLEDQGYQVDLHSGSYGEDELVEHLQKVDMVGIRSKTQLTDSVLKKAPHLNAVGCFCIGTNQVDLITAQKLGIPVFNAPYSNTRSVAELVLSEIVALSRKLCHLSHQVHQGEWKKSAVGSREVRGKTLGIVGYGHIGSQVSILAEAFGLKVLYYDVIKKLPLGNSQAVEDLNDLLSASDFVTLHVPETPETENLMGSSQIAKMKQGACLLNLSRGNVVDIDGLAEALKSGHLAGAAVDVYPKEPKNNQETFSSPLQGIDNVILTPHVGGSTEEAQLNIGIEVSTALATFGQLGQTLGAVGFPQVTAPQRPDCHRILNIHKNVPGVLGQINSIVSELGVNIRGQYLATTKDIGFLLVDIEKGHQEIFEKVNSLETSIKSRLVY